MMEGFSLLVAFIFGAVSGWAVGFEIGKSTRWLRRHVLTVWRDGTSKVQEPEAACYARGDDDWLMEVGLDELVTVAESGGTDVAARKVSDEEVDLK